MFFLWGGADYSKKDTAPITIHRDGFMRVRDGNGNVIFEIGQKNSKAVFNIYNESGELIAEIGGSGIQYRNYTPEYYEKIELAKANISFTEQAILDYLKREVLIRANSTYNSNTRESKEWAEAYVVNQSRTAYLYFAGRNFEMEGNKQYENTYFASKNKLGETIPDGVYFHKYLTSVHEEEEARKVFQGKGVDLTITAYQIREGKILKSKSVKVNINTRDYNTDFSDWYSGGI